MANPTPTGAPRVQPGRDSLAAHFARLTREDLTAIVAAAIDELDARDPDIDVELNGDEADGSAAEDDYHPQSENWKGEPGCPLADPGGDEHEVLTTRPVYGEDQSLGPVNEHAALRARYETLIGAAA